MSSDADAWHVPGRPTHPDFFVISDLILQGDAASNEETGEEFIADALRAARGRIQGTLDVDLPMLVQETAGLPPKEAAAVAWAAGFGAGMRIARDAPTDVMVEAGASAMDLAFLGADPGSVAYMARQRGMRVVDLLPDQPVEVLLGSAWLDGAVTGSRFEARRAKLAGSGSGE